MERGLELKEPGYGAGHWEGPQATADAEGVLPSRAIVQLCCRCRTCCGCRHPQQHVPYAGIRQHVGRRRFPPTQAPTHSCLVPVPSQSAHLRTHRSATSLPPSSACSCGRQSCGTTAKPLLPPLRDDAVDAWGAAGVGNDAGAVGNTAAATAAAAAPGAALAAVAAAAPLGAKSFVLVLFPPRGACCLGGQCGDLPKAVLARAGAAEVGATDRAAVAGIASQTACKRVQAVERR